jgi:hypothetical protein
VQTLRPIKDSPPAGAADARPSWRADVRSRQAKESVLEHRAQQSQTAVPGPIVNSLAEIGVP